MKRDDVPPGTIVSTYFDTGARGAALLLGVVLSARPKTFVIRWESGFANTVPYNTPKGVKVVTDPELIDEATRVLTQRGYMPNAR